MVLKVIGTNEEKKERGITIDLSFSNMSKGQQNIALLMFPGHEKLVKIYDCWSFWIWLCDVVISKWRNKTPNCWTYRNHKFIRTKRDNCSNYKKI